MDQDLDTMTRAQLLAEVKKLRAAIREHRDSWGHDLCWYHPGLWGCLPEQTDPVPDVPTWPQFMQGCVTFRRSLDVQLAQAARVDISFEAQQQQGSMNTSDPVGGTSEQLK